MTFLGYTAGVAGAIILALTSVATGNIPLGLAVLLIVFGFALVHDSKPARI